MTLRKAAKGIINEIIHDIVRTTPSLQILKYRIFGLLNTMLNALAEIRITMNTKLFDDVDIVNRFTNAKSITELQEQINYIFEIIIKKCYDGNEDISSDEKYKKIVQYVKDNYTNPNISVSNISVIFGMSISALSRLFKKNMGIGLLDYIHKLRIEKAKELLKTTDMNLRDIARTVGYYNDVAMIRAFKKYEGITPGKLREMETHKTSDEQ